jgi:hypothetical protein
LSAHLSSIGVFWLTNFFFFQNVLKFKYVFFSRGGKDNNTLNQTLSPVETLLKIADITESKDLKRRDSHLNSTESSKLIFFLKTLINKFLLLSNNRRSAIEQSRK